VRSSFLQGEWGAGEVQDEAKHPEEVVFIFIIIFSK
jgi:hypothetical protein